MKKTATKNEIQVNTIQSFQDAMNMVEDFLTKYFERAQAHDITQEIFTTPSVNCRLCIEEKYRVRYFLNPTIMEILKKYLSQEEDVQHCADYIFNIGTDKNYLSVLHVAEIQAVYAGAMINGDFSPDALDYINSGVF